ncbi:MAG: type I-U CRISPR-associated protein Cas5/Cas6 [Gemmatimonadetes bacterium]|nr:type I-U CRISPR-associated protein Cas5/Cas6 [Gemmatimonadota bacterium]
MFGFAFRFPTGRYHATPWGRNVNEADVAWPPEPWRILRALIACYWRKTDRVRWSESHLEELIDTLAEEPPVYRLPPGAVHSHVRHYMPVPRGKSETRKLVFDAFLHLPDGAEVEVRWPELTLEEGPLEFADDLAAGIGYLGRAESWTECRVLTEARGDPNCGPAESGFEGDAHTVLVPRSTDSYRQLRKRLIEREAENIRVLSKKPLTPRVLQSKVHKSFRTKGRGGVDTLPERLLDAISLDTADLQQRKWNRPPAAYEAIYARAPDARPGVLSRIQSRPVRSGPARKLPTVARYLLEGRPLPRIEDAIKIGEVMRAAALSKFGWRTDDTTGRRFPLAPWQISGRELDGGPVRDPGHPHAFWLPEDADDDGWIDHLTVFIADGMAEEIRSELDRITRLWLTPRAGRESGKGNIDEWRLALEGFGWPRDFEGSSRLLTTSRRWRSVTPFLASGYLKKDGYGGEARRLLKRRGISVEDAKIAERQQILVAGMPRSALHFHRFRSRGRERQPDAQGAFLEIEFPEVVQGPLALGFASHFGLGMFGGDVG